MELFEAIYARRSVRKFYPDEISDDIINCILEAGIRAPSGKNGQPWRFIVVRNKLMKDKLADLTIYGSIVRDSNVVIFVFLDKTESYNYIKDNQSAGACIQNIQLAATALNVGSCWIGEILNREIMVRNLLKIEKRYALMAAIALGKDADNSKKTARRRIDDFILNTIL